MMAKKALWKLERHAQSGPFRQPVDTKQYPEYIRFVEKPMDLSTIRKKLYCGEYTSKDAYSAEIGLIWRNAKAFNPPGHPVFLAADRLSQLFEGVR